MANEAKIQEQIVKLESANGSLAVKIAVNKKRIREAIGKLAGVKAGDIVTSKGERYQVAEVASETLPKKGKPILSGFKIHKNGKKNARPSDIAGAWVKEEKKQTISAKKGRKPAVAAKRRGRPSKAALAAAAVEGTA